MRKAWLRLLALTRWLHIYLSMVGLVMVLFFAVTGITLNHPKWFGVGVEGSVKTEVRTLEMDVPLRAEEVDRLELVERLRRDQAMSGSVTSFEADEYECVVVFKRPGMVADVLIDRETNEATITIERSGAVAIINDLHMARHSGPWWSLVVDLSAGLMALSALTGLVLLFGLPKRRRWGLALALVGGAVFVAVAVWLIP